MSGESLEKVPASEVRVGNRVRLANGAELEVSRIEDDFLHMPGMIAFIEDTPERWFKAPVAATAEVEVISAS